MVLILIGFVSQNKKLLKDQIISFNVIQNRNIRQIVVDNQKTKKTLSIVCEIFAQLSLLKGGY